METVKGAYRSLHITNLADTLKIRDYGASIPMHTESDRHPISPGVAAALSTHDLEAILSFTFISGKDPGTDKTVSDTIGNCAGERILRDKQ